MIKEIDAKSDQKKLPVLSNRIRAKPVRYYKPKINLKECDRCMVCVAVCPEGAIEMRQSGPVINYNLCKGCLVCVRECIQGAIGEEKE